MKRKLLFIFMFMLCSSLSFSISKKSDDEFDDQSIKYQKSFASELKTAKKYYFDGDFVKAEEIISNILEQSSYNEKANELKNRILLLKERRAYYKKNLVNDYLIELRRDVKDGNYYEGLLYIKKINDLAIGENVDMFHNRLVSEKENVLSSMEDSSDRKKLIKSIDLFVNEKYTEALNLIYKLYEKYPKFVDYVGMCRYYTIKENNIERVNSLYKQIRSSLDKNRLGEAKNFAVTAYSLQPDNIKLKILIDQIDMEMI